MLYPAKRSPLQQELHDTISCLRHLVQTLYTIHTEYINRSLFQTQQPHNIMTQRANPELAAGDWHQARLMPQQTQASGKLN